MGRKESNQTKQNQVLFFVHITLKNNKSNFAYFFLFLIFFPSKARFFLLVDLQTLLL